MDNPTTNVAFWCLVVMVILAPIADFMGWME